MSDRDERIEEYVRNWTGWKGDCNCSREWRCPACALRDLIDTELDTVTRCYQRWEELYHQRRANELAADERAFRAEERVQHLISVKQGYRDAELTKLTDRIQRLTDALKATPCVNAEIGGCANTLPDAPCPRCAALAEGEME